MQRADTCEAGTCVSRLPNKFQETPVRDRAEGALATSLGEDSSAANPSISVTCDEFATALNISDKVAPSFVCESAMTSTAEEVGYRAECVKDPEGCEELSGSGSAQQESVDDVMTEKPSYVRAAIRRYSAGQGKFY